MRWERNVLDVVKERRRPFDKGHIKCKQNTYTDKLLLGGFGKEKKTIKDRCVILFKFKVYLKTKNFFAVSPIH